MGKLVADGNQKCRMNTWKLSRMSIFHGMVEGSVDPFVIDEVEKALGVMKNGKADEPTGIVKRHLAAFPHRKQNCK